MKPYYQDSLSTIYHGNSHELIHNFPGALVVTDPPYNVGYKYDGYADNLAAEDYNEIIMRACRFPAVIIHYPEDMFKIPFEQRPEKCVSWVYNSNMPRQWRIICWFECEPDFSLMGQPYKKPLRQENCKADRKWRRGASL